MKASERLSEEVINKIREAIEDAGGCEVMACGVIGGDGIIDSAVIAARGDDGSVPAVFEHMSRGDVVIHNHPGGLLKPSKADMAVAGSLGEQGIGFFIVDNSVEKLYAVVEPVEGRERRDIDIEALAGLLEPDGNLEQAMEAGGFYEYRPSQVAMLKKIAESYNEGRICVAEAGTGVGKSMAYLLPSLRWASDNRERVVVSTATINLQHQLTDKDIPLAKKILGIDNSVCLVKGRGNYVCLRRLAAALDEMTLFDEKNDELQSISEWAEKSSSGTRDDLPFMPDASLWSKICSEGDSCLGIRCRKREKCFVIKSKKDAAAASVLVVNHHLLFSDLAMRHEGAGMDNAVVLPPFSRIVFDEAHNMESSATSFFSSELNKFSVLKQAGLLYSSKRGRRFGAILNLQIEAGAVEDDEKLPGMVDDIKDQMQVLDAAGLAFLDNDTSCRITPANKGDFVADVLPEMIKLQNRIIDCLNGVEAIIRRMNEDDRELPVVFETRVLERRLEALSSVCQSFSIIDEKPGEVFWLEKKKDSSGEAFVRFVITPLDISKLMREAVFCPYETVVCTSATISVNRDFRFWAARVGLSGFEDRPVSASVYNSPFPYRDNVLLCIPSDAPDPNTPEHSDFIVEYSSKLLEVSEGRALLLFTSYRMLMDVYERLRPVLEAAGITALRQGEDDRTRLLERFKSDTASVLFATSSFWEGIDTPGDALRVVIICKLPFMVPSDPVISARMEAIERRGGNQFMDFMLPEAVIKFKQGFGRLMRRGTDSGVVAVLDPRIVNKAYGRIFINSLPETARSVKEAERTIEDAEVFLYRER